MAGIKAMGAKLSYEDTGKKFVAHLTSLGAITKSNEDLDTTDHDSPDGAKEFMAGDVVHDNVSFAGNIVADNDTFKRLWALADARTEKQFTAEYADGSKFAFTGYIAKITMSEQTTDGLMTYEGEIKISTGKPVFTPKG